MSAAGRVTVVTVTYDSAAVIGQCLGSIPKGVPVIVVDNASGDGTRAQVHAARADAHLIENTHNAGFGRGCNQGAAAAATEFVFFLNPDAALDQETIAALVACADRNPCAALFGPRILGLDDRPETSWDAPLFERARMPPHDNTVPEGDACVGFLSGAALLWRAESGAGPGPFDPFIFLFYDDDDLCLRLRRAGRALIYVAAATVRHFPGRGSPDTARIQWRRSVHMAWSRLYLEEKYQGGAALLAARSALRFGLKCAGYALSGERTKTRRDAARFWGTVQWLAGVRRMR